MYHRKDPRLICSTHGHIVVVRLNTRAFGSVARNDLVALIALFAFTTITITDLVIHISPTTSR